MFDEITVKGIVLYTSPVREYDKRLVVLSDELGKITVFANGARRPKSRYGAVCQSFTMAEFKLREGRDSYTLISAEIKEAFREMTADIRKLCYASYMCEFAGYYTHAGERARDELNLLYVSFKALIAGNMPDRLIKNIFELRMLGIEGVGLNVFSCTVCGRKENLKAVSIKRGGLICSDCAKSFDRALTGISQSAIYTIRYIMTEPLSRLYSFKLSDELFCELSQLADGCVGEYVEKKFNSLDILNTLG